MKYVISALCAIVICLSFAGRKCEHVFTQVEQAEVKIEQPNWHGVDDLMPAWTKWPSGKQEGKELICVKCFYKQKQILDYGPSQFGIPANSDTIPSKWLRNQKAISESDYKPGKILWGSSGSIASDNSFTYDTLNKKSSPLPR